MENNTDHSEQKSFSPLSVQDVDVDFLPLVYEIIRRYLMQHLFIGRRRKLFFLCDINFSFLFFSVERDYHDNSAKARESQDCSQKVLELQKKFDIARSQVQ